MTLAELLNAPLYVSTAHFDRRWSELAATLPLHAGTIVGAETPVVRVTPHSTGTGRVMLGETATLYVKLYDGTLVDVPAGTEASPRAGLSVGTEIELLGALELRGGDYRKTRSVLVGPRAVRRRRKV